MNAAFVFSLPPELAAAEPPERRGLRRDGVRLIVLNRRTGAVSHTVFHRLTEFLRQGDLLVFNCSRTLPAIVDGTVFPTGADIEVRLAEHLPDGSWSALLLSEGRATDHSMEGGQLRFAEHVRARVGKRDERIPLLWGLNFSRDGSELMDWLFRNGRPVRYEHVSKPWCLDYYQTVYAREPGSAEMPSAGRAFTWQMLAALQNRGVDSAHVVLHTGLSSYMNDEFDALHVASEEEYFVSEQAAKKVNRARAAGRRVIAVGTTVVRALESAATDDGRVRPGHRYTQLRISSEHTLRVVDGLLTGLHEPEASHLDLLTAFVAPKTIRDAYEDAVRRRYLWHEFGDLNLIL